MQKEMYMLHIVYNIQLEITTRIKENLIYHDPKHYSAYL